MRDVVASIESYYERGMGFLFRLIDECPDELWGKKGGGFFFWQQLYHAFYCVNYFLLPAGSELPEKPYGRAAAMLSETIDTVPSKDEIREYGREMKANADAWIAALEDGALGDRHEGMSERRKTELNNASVLTSLCGHNMYHVGCLDSVLRENGLKGVY
ncbi:MAG: DinB family protein [Synergistaceae bacterium]|nr:DinB family protein [Synergistaceae bacterium]